MNTNSTKADLRKKLLAQRKELNPDDVSTRSQQLAQMVIDTIDWNSCQKLHCFLPLLNDNEPDLRKVFEYAIDQGVDVYTSRPEAKTSRRVIELEAHDIPDYILLEQEEFDYIIVPMLAYDPKTNHRLGFGGGFYDRLIVQQQSAQTIGVCFKEFTADLPVEEHDQVLEMIKTA